MDPSLTLAEFGSNYLGGKSVKTAKRVVMQECIPHYKVRGTILIKQSDADAWRESKRVEPTAPTLRMRLAGIAARIRAKEAAREAACNSIATDRV